MKTVTATPLDILEQACRSRTAIVRDVEQTCIDVVRDAMQRAHEDPEADNDPYTPEHQENVAAAIAAYAASQFSITNPHPFKPEHITKGFAAYWDTLGGDVDSVPDDSATYGRDVIARVDRIWREVGELYRWRRSS